MLPGITPEVGFDKAALSFLCSNPGLLSSVEGTTTKITTIPVTSKPNVIVVQKTTGKGATIQGLPGKNVVTTLLNAGVGENLCSLNHCMVTDITGGLQKVPGLDLSISRNVCFALCFFLCQAPCVPMKLYD